MTKDSLDTSLTIGRRLRLVKSLRNKGNFSEAVLDAIKAIPRHIFVERGLEDFAYENTPIAIGNGQTISQPETVALQTQLLAPQKGSKVLEIGTGCGYQSAILRYLGVRLFTIERQKELCLAAKGNLGKLGYSDIYMKWGDGFEGLPEFAPFDGIIVTCGAPDVPENLLKQLNVGGKMVIPVDIAQAKGQQLQVLTRNSATEFTRKILGTVDFVPMLKGKTSQGTNPTTIRNKKSL
ncbi:MAG: protein-L-isoaspartate(D-aspartate) O-methyltransferase [Candidatus Egerieousia sp.]